MERTTISFVCVFTLCCFTLPRNTLAQAPYSPIFMLIQSAFGSDEYRLPNERLDPIFGALERGEYDLAIGMCNEAIRDSKESWAPAYILRGQVWLKKGDYDNAFADFNRAIQVDPKCAAAYMHRGETWARMGEYDRAIADYDQAIRTDPGYAFSYHRRGDAWYLKGQYDKALADYNQAIRVAPYYEDFFNALAWLQATCPRAQYRNAEEALKNAMRAYELDRGRSPGIIDTVAAAYAENDEFDLACAWEEKAIELASTEEIKQEFRSRLELYQRERPYRELPMSY